LLGSIENVEPTEEQGPKVVGAGTGNGLHADNAFLPDRGRVSTQYKTGSSGGEFWETSDRKVFVVEGGIVQQNLGGLVSNDIGISSRDTMRVTQALAFFTTGNTHGLESSSL